MSSQLTSRRNDVGRRQLALQPATVLFLAANPGKTAELQLGAECRVIEDMIRKGTFREQIHFRSRWAARPDDLIQALNEDCPSVLHFSGHGTGEQGLCFQADDGSIRTVSASALAAVIQAAGGDVSIVVLNACYSEVQAQALIAHVPCVIGMADAIGDDMAIVYAASFYRALAFGHSVANAHQQGMAALTLTSGDGPTRDIKLPDSGSTAPARTTDIKLLVKSGADANGVYLVQAHSTKTRCMVIVKATLREFDASVLIQITELLRQWSGDLSLEVTNVDDGSVRLTIDLSPAAAKQLVEHWASGRMVEICGFAVTAVLELPVAYRASDTRKITAATEARRDPAVAREVPRPVWPETEPGKATHAPRGRVKILTLSAVIGAALAVGWFLFRPTHVPQPPLSGMVGFTATDVRPGVFDRALRPAECSAFEEAKDCPEVAHPGPAAPRHVNAFALDTREVSNGEVARWLNATADSWEIGAHGVIATRREPKASLVVISDRCGLMAAENGRVIASVDKARWAAGCVTWYGADEYCRYYGKRLPLTAEWELAAQGQTGRPFPWGEQPPQRDRVAYGRHEGTAAHPSDVGSSPQDATPEGVRDLAGNVAEWIDDRDDDGITRTIRGGSWNSVDVCHLLTSSCQRLPANRTSTDIGFRCASSTVKDKLQEGL